MLRTNVRQLIHKVVRAHTKMLKYYHGPFQNRAKNSDEKLKHLDEVVRIDTRDALNELDHYIKDLNNVRRALAKADRRIEGNSIDQYSLTIEGGLLTVKRFGEIYHREIIS